MSDTNGSGDAEEISTYQTSVFQRRLSFLSVAALLLLASMEATDGGPVLELSLINVMLTGGMLLATASYGLRATIRVSETEIRKERPLWKDNALRFKDIQKARLPLTAEALWLYADSGGSPDLSVDADSFERFGDLTCQVLRRLPEGAEIHDPAGRIEEYQCDGDPTGGSEAGGQKD